MPFAAVQVLRPTGRIGPKAYTVTLVVPLLDMAAANGKSDAVESGDPMSKNMNRPCSTLPSAQDYRLEVIASFLPKGKAIDLAHAISQFTGAQYGESEVIQP